MVALVVIDLYPIKIEFIVIGFTSSTISDIFVDILLRILILKVHFCSVKNVAFANGVGENIVTCPITH